MLYKILSFRLWEWKYFFLLFAGFITHCSTKNIFSYFLYCGFSKFLPNEGKSLFCPTPDELVHVRSIPNQNYEMETYLSFLCAIVTKPPLEKEINWVFLPKNVFILSRVLLLRIKFLSFCFHKKGSLENRSPCG